MATIAKERQAIRANRCSRCHAPFNSDFRFCPSCGAPIDRPIKAGRDSPPEPVLIFEEDQAESEEIDTIFV